LIFVFPSRSVLGNFCSNNSPSAFSLTCSTEFRSLCPCAEPQHSVSF
jgi:hypothetical protein